LKEIIKKKTLVSLNLDTFKVQIQMLKLF